MDILKELILSETLLTGKFIQLGLYFKKVNNSASIGKYLMGTGKMFFSGILKIHI